MFGKWKPLTISVYGIRTYSKDYYPTCGKRVNIVEIQPAVNTKLYINANKSDNCFCCHKYNCECKQPFNA
jgi:hypothetical protein